MAFDGGAVLVVDDDVGTVETFTLILRPLGFEVITALSAQHSISILRADSAKLLRLALLDLRLPDTSGLEVLAEIQINELSIPTVMMSAWWTEAARFAAERLGAVDLVDKPLFNEDLIRLVQKNVVHAHSARTTSTTVGYATRRWAEIVGSVVTASEDVPTLAAWAHLVGESLSTLKARCSAVSMRPSDSLDFARVLRVVKGCAGEKCDWQNALAVVDSRTLEKLLSRAALPRHGMLPKPGLFFRNQTFVTDETLVAAIQSFLESSQQIR